MEMDHSIDLQLALAGNELMMHFFLFKSFLRQAVLQVSWQNPVFTRFFLQPFWCVWW